jgi:hypothetical protein
MNILKGDSILLTFYNIIFNIINIITDIKSGSLENQNMSLN